MNEEQEKERYEEVKKMRASDPHKAAFMMIDLLAEADSHDVADPLKIDIYEVATSEHVPYLRELDAKQGGNTIFGTLANKVTKKLQE